MNCPKCDGGAYVSEEEVVNVLENTMPVKVILKVTYVCKSCNERFSRVFWEDVEATRKRPEAKDRKTKEWKPAPGMPTSEFAVRPGMSLTGETKETPERLKFLDDI